MEFVREWISRLRSFLRGARNRARFEREMAEEFRHHMAVRAEDLMRQGLPAREAAKRARLEFGHVEVVKEGARAARGLEVLDRIGMSWLDMKLGIRMVRKYPGLSVVSVLGMAVAIAVAAGGFGFLQAIMDPTLPLPNDERIVALHNADARNPGNPDRRSVHDFFMWRDEVSSVQDISAFMSERRNFIVSGGAADVVQVAKMTASGFRVTGVAPIMGRPLTEADEAPGAPAVVVIGEQEWRRRFSEDPDIIGRTTRLGTAEYRVVGVMPQGYRFPINHQYWTPLRLDATAHGIGTGPEIHVFGRLVEGATIARAQAELGTIGRRMASTYPATHEHLRPQVVPYAHPFFDIDSPSMVLVLRVAQVAISLLLVVVAVNVAVLVYTRTATRAGEIAVRTALGASRRRVVVQLFLEAIVLSSMAAAVGLAIAATALEAVQSFLDRSTNSEVPFWFDLGLSFDLIVYVAGLAVAAGAIVGIVPAIKVTGPIVRAGLDQLPSRGATLQLGRTWTTLIVIQVAVAVAALPFALAVAGQSTLRGVAQPEYDVDAFLRGSVFIERDNARRAERADVYEEDLEARFQSGVAELMRRLEEEPGVTGVTFASRFPGGEWFGRVEIEGTGERGSSRVNRVDVDLFSVFDIPMLAGRAFTDADSRADARTVIVDRVFAERFFGGGNVLGRRLRQIGRRDDGEVEEGPWLEVVGVVPTFTVQPDFDPADAKLYAPTALMYDAEGLDIAVRVRAGTDPGSVAGRMRQLAPTIDPALQIRELRTASAAEQERQQGLLFIALGIVAVTLSVLLLCAAGIYAMMSFTVTRRRREIGIRAALGANPRLLLGGVFARAGAQLGTGVLIGLAIAFALDGAMGGSPLSTHWQLLMPIVAVIILVIGLFAALGPARRGLAVQPTEALRES